MGSSMKSDDIVHWLSFDHPSLVVIIPGDLVPYINFHGDVEHLPLTTMPELYKVAEEAVLARLRVAKAVDETKRKYQAWLDAGSPVASGAVINR